MFIRTVCIAIVLCLPLSAASLSLRAAEAVPAGEGAETRGVQENPPISRRRASELVSEQYAGRILRLELELESGRWRVRLDNGGTVFNVFVDARTGEITVPDQ